MMDHPEPLLSYAVVEAYFGKTAIEKEKLPQGISNVEHWHPRNWKEWFHLLRYKVIVTVDGVPNKEHYKIAAERNGLTLADRAEALFDRLQHKGKISLNIKRYNDTVASVSYIPSKMENRHEVTVYKPGYIDLGTRLLAQYLNLQRV